MQRSHQEKRFHFHIEIRKNVSEAQLRETRQAYLDFGMIITQIHQLLQKEQHELPSFIQEINKLLQNQKNRLVKPKMFLPFPDLKILLLAVESSIYVNGFEDQPSILNLVEWILYQLDSEETEDVLEEMKYFSRIFSKYSQKENPLTNTNILNIVDLVFQDVSSNHAILFIENGRILEYIQSLTIQDLNFDNTLSLFSIMNSQVFRYPEAFKHLACFVVEVQKNIDKQCSDSSELLKETLRFWNEVLSDINGQTIMLNDENLTSVLIKVVNYNMNYLLRKFQDLGEYDAETTLLIFEYMELQIDMKSDDLTELLVSTYPIAKFIASQLDPLMITSSWIKQEDLIKFTLCLIDKLEKSGSILSRYQKRLNYLSNDSVKIALIIGQQGSQKLSPIRFQIQRLSYQV